MRTAGSREPQWVREHGGTCAAELLRSARGSSSVLTCACTVLIHASAIVHSATTTATRRSGSSRAIRTDGWNSGAWGAGAGGVGRLRGDGMESASKKQQCERHR